MTNHVNIKREQFYIADQGATLFAWLHTSESKPRRDCVAIICNPTGHEYAHSHRSLRHLADRLASSGIPALRFDYHGTGDSDGSDLDPARIQTWKNNIRAVMTHARAATGARQVCLIGVRLGATLASLLSAEIPLDLLVLWNPAVSGRRYVRELQAIAAASGRERIEGSEFIESAGFLLSNETADQLKKINLLEQKFQINNRVLLLNRDDLSSDTALCEKLTADGIAVDEVAVAGYDAMMAEPHFTVVPEQALDLITRWLAEQSSVATVVVTTPQTSNGGKISKETYIERPCFFGREQKLFGVMCESNGSMSAPTESPIVVMLNSGSLHHVGPNFLYVTLARHLAANGISSLRMNLRGLGDSVIESGEDENNAYPSTALTDIELTLQYLHAQFGPRRFILLGLCSGAHYAFRAGVELPASDIAHLVLINPLTYHWRKGDVLTIHRREVLYLRSVIFRLESWKKLLTLKLQTSIRLKIAVVLTELKLSIKKLFVSTDNSPLSMDIKTVLSKKQTMSLFIAGTDPGFDILMDDAKKVTIKAMKTDQIRVQFFDDSDHIFSDHAGRVDLINRLTTQIKDVSKSLAASGKA